MSLILAIDQGTTSSRAIVFNFKGQLISHSQKEHNLIYPQAAWVEINPMEIWENVVLVCDAAVKKAGGWDKIKTIGIANQRETILAWDNSKILENAIVWQCRRTANMVKILIEEGYSNVFHKKTGLILDAYFSGTKIKWLLDHSDSVENALKSRSLRFGTIDSYLIYKMSGKHVTDVSNASRTLLFDLKNKEWSNELLEILKIPDWVLPEVIPSISYDPGDRYWQRDSNKIPILGIGGDQQSALFGQTAFNKGESKVTYGTGNFALTNIGTTVKYSHNGLLTTVAWSIGEIQHITYALEGSVFITGALIQWLRDELRIIQNVQEIEVLAKNAGDIGSLIIVPAFVGLGAPYWDQSARGTILGITRRTNRNHLAKAALESIAMQTVDIVTLLESESQAKVIAINVDGGASRNDYLMEIQASLLQKNVLRPKNIETTALGAALMAGIGAEVWPSLSELKEINQIEARFTPDPLYPHEYKLSLWDKAVKRSLNWAGLQSNTEKL